MKSEDRVKVMIGEEVYIYFISCYTVFCINF